MPGSPDNLKRLITNEVTRWAEVIKFAGMKPE